jgi:CRP-like cAMP-binding protein
MHGMPSRQEITDNHILAALPPDERARLSAEFEPVRFTHGQKLFNYNTQIQHVYFPTTSIVSLITEMDDDGSSLETAMVSHQGVVGVSFFMGGEATIAQAIVQTPGLGYRLNGKSLMREFNRAGEFQKILLRYTIALLYEISQTLVCNRHHSKEQQLCRWLLLRFQCLPGNSLMITQQHIAHLLGVRRSVVSEIVGNLQTAEIIKIERGRIALMDRAALESRVCECYELIQKRFDEIAE